jgi:hypothetical protein
MGQEPHPVVGRDNRRESKDVAQLNIPTRPIWPGGQQGEVAETDSHNQGVSRAVNDLIYNTLWGVAAEEGGFLCECGAPARQQRDIPNRFPSSVG